MKNNISEDDVINAQGLWADHVIQIGDLYTNNADYKKAAYDFVSNFYAYGIGNVLFKPTLATKNQFRLKFDDALSYFVGGSIKEDKGFALNTWESIEWNNAKVIIKHDIAICMGKYYFNSCDGDSVEAEYSFVYQKNKNNKLKIILHHSSVPYNKRTSYTSIISNIMKSALK